MIIRKYFLIPLFLLCFAFVNSQSYASEKALFSLSPEEKVWLDAHPVIRLGFHKDWEPAVIVNEDGKLSGFLVDFFDQLNRQFGMNIVIETGAWPDIVQQARNQEIDGLLACAPIQAKASGLLPTHSHFTVYPAIFARESAQMEIRGFRDLEGKTVAKVKGYAFAKALLKHYEKRIDLVDTVWLPTTSVLRWMQKISSAHTAWFTISKVWPVIFRLRTCRRPQ